MKKTDVKKITADDIKPGNLVLCDSSFLRVRPKFYIAEMLYKIRHGFCDVKLIAGGDAFYWDFVFETTIHIELRKLLTVINRFFYKPGGLYAPQFLFSTGENIKCADEVGIFCVTTCNALKVFS
jgi:hypothetical protein